MLKSKEKLLNLAKVFFKYFFALSGIIVSLILTLGIVVNLLELSNTGSLIGNFGFLIADKFYYYFGTPGLILSISGFIASARFLTNSENKEISKKILDFSKFQTNQKKWEFQKISKKFHVNPKPK